MLCSWNVIAMCPIVFQFTKPRFGGTHVAAAKPNLSVARKPTQVNKNNIATVSIGLSKQVS